jgi:hypothetical protein
MDQDQINIQIYVAIFGCIFLFVLAGIIYYVTHQPKSADEIINDAIAKDGSSLISFSYDEPSLIAVLKGSIYESGETIWIYGVCYQATNVTNEEFVDANSTIKIFQGNGTILVYANMTNVSVGHYVYQWTVPHIQETFLTEMNCSYNGLWALAWGEVQNPIWTNRIGNISSTYHLTLNTLSFPEQISSFDNFTTYLSYSLSNGSMYIPLDLLNISILYKNNTILTEESISDLILYRNIYKFEYDLNNTEIGDYYLRIQAEYKNVGLLSSGYFKVIEGNETSLDWITSVESEQIINTPAYFVTQIISNHNISNIDCDLVTNFWGVNPMIKDFPSRSFQYLDSLNETGEFIWSVTCYEA